MLSLNDFKEKKILFVHSNYDSENKLKLTNDNIIFTRNDEISNQVPIHNIFTIFIIGDMSITTNLIKKLITQGISIFFLNYNLTTKAICMSEAEGNFLLKEKQYACTNGLEISKNIVINKISIQEKILKKSNKDYDINIFINAYEKLKHPKDLDQLRGIEGNIAKIYFQTLFHDLNWMRRAPQTKENIENLLLDIGYTYLLNYCDSLLRLFGFDTYKGYYHQLFFQRKSLACDIMEPMRPLIDYQLIKSYNLKQIHENDFVFKNGRFEFKQGFKTSKIYSSIFLETINKNRKNIYTYILLFYRYIMDSDKYEFPTFKISQN